MIRKNPIQKAWRAWRDAHALRGEILRIAWPTIVEQVLVMLVGTVSTVLVGRISAEALSAVGMVNAVISFLQAVLAALSTGITVLVARLTGARDYIGAQRAMHQALLIALAAAALITTLTAAFMRPMLLLFMGSADPLVVDLAEEYFSLALWSFPLFIINLVLAGSFRGVGNMRLPMLVALLGNVINVLLGMLLIYGVGPIPAMGLRGAGIAVMIARAVSGFVILLAVFVGKNRVYIPLRSFFRFDGKIVRRIFAIGIPASIEQMTMTGGNLLMQSIVALMGTAAMAGYQIVNAVHNLIMMPLSGLGIAITTIVGQCLGAKDILKARRSIRQTMGIGYIIVFCGVAMLVFAGEPVSGMFTQDPGLAREAAKICYILAFVELTMPTMNIGNNSLRGAGDVRFVTYNNIIGLIVIRSGLTYALFAFLHWQLEAVYWAYFIDCFVRSIINIVRLRGDAWTKKNV